MPRHHRSVTWIEEWRSRFGSEPLDRTSREVSVQDVLAALIVGRRPAWFEQCDPTAEGRLFLRGFSQLAFGDVADEAVVWFVSEYALPVPDEWRADIGLSYGCPDLAWGSRSRVVVVELKTERASFRRRQMSDYLRLARRKHPDEWIDMVLLGPHRPGDRPPHDPRQRYVELDWGQVPALLLSSFPHDKVAEQLARFLSQTFDAGGVASADVRAVPAALATSELSDVAVAHAQRIAPSVAEARAGDRTERGINVALPSIEAARSVQEAVKASLRASDVSRRVSVWLWRTTSGGVAATEAGRATGRELRLAPVGSSRPADGRARASP
jgi:hypothetical protein